MTRRVRALAGLTALPWVLVILTGGCAPRHEVTPATPDESEREASALRAVSLPDLSRLAESVQDQVRARHASLTEKLADRTTSPVELGTAYGDLGLILMATEHYEVATSCFLNAQALVPDAMRWPYYLGHLYKVTGAAARAAESFTRALELRPTDLATLVWLGEMYLDQDRPETAEPLFNRALSVDPRSAAALAGVGRAALARHDAARAADYLERALSVEPRASSLHYLVAMAYRALGDLEKADTHLQQRGGGQPTRPDPLMEEYAGLLRSPLAYEIRGMRALEDGQVATAAAIFREGLELDPADPALRHRLGTVLAMAGDTRGAMEQFEETLLRTPEFAKAHFGLGMLLYLSDRHHEAAERFSAALTHQPNYLEARLGLAEALRVAGRLEESLPHYEHVAEIDPGFAEAWMARAMALIRLERYQEARVWFYRSPGSTSR